MPFIPPETIERARQMDLLTYLRTFEPDELVHIGGNHYCTREHDSLKISNGKWYWFSRGFGGYNALDYLVKVKDVPFVEAVERISGVSAYTPPTTTRTEKAKKPKVLLLPKVPDTLLKKQKLKPRSSMKFIIFFTTINLQKPLCVNL